MKRISSTTSYTYPVHRNKSSYLKQYYRPICARPSASSNRIKMISVSGFVLIFTIIQLMLGFNGMVECQTGDGSQKVEQQIQCYACGLPKVDPEGDIKGSYGKKLYNHSCIDFINHLNRKGKSIQGNDYESKFIRTCPVGVKSCFGAKGFYDRDDEKVSNDISVTFFGCSEARHKQDYGCDEDDQTLDVRDKFKKWVQVPIKVNLCFCSNHLCNHPEGEMFNGASQSSLHDQFLKIMVMVLMTHFFAVRVTKSLSM